MPKPCRIKWVKPPKAECACGKEFELDSYTKTKSTPVQTDQLLDMISAHLKDKAANAEKSK